jgi:probable HAF family extracellular repeat protein
MSFKESSRAPTRNPSTSGSTVFVVEVRIHRVRATYLRLFLLTACLATSFLTANSFAASFFALPRYPVLTSYAATHLDAGIPFPYAITPDGNAIVGSILIGSFRSGNRNYLVRRAFLWTRRGGLHILPDLGGYETSARAVSDDGLTVSGNSRVPWGTQQLHAFRWTQQTGAMDLGTLGGQPYSWSMGSVMSADGATISGMSVNAIGHGRVYRWTAGTGMVDIGTFGSGGLDINGASRDATTLLGEYGLGDNYFPFVFNSSSGYTSLPGGSRGGRAFDISGDLSTIVGQIWEAGLNRGCYWTDTVSYHLLPGPWDIGIQGGAGFVSADGRRILGWSGYDFYDGKTIIWPGDGSWAYLQDKYSAVVPTGWRLYTAGGMTPDGRFIVGVAVNTQNQFVTYLLDTAP